MINKKYVDLNHENFYNNDTFHYKILGTCICVVCKEKMSYFYDRYCNGKLQTPPRQKIRYCFPLLTPLKWNTSGLLGMMPQLRVMLERSMNSQEANRSKEERTTT